MKCKGNGLLQLFDWCRTMEDLGKSTYREKSRKPDRKFRLCNCCKEMFEVTPFANMRGDGVNLHSHIEIYEEEFDLCPKCTLHVYKYIKSDKTREIVERDD